MTSLVTGRLNLLIMETYSVYRHPPSHQQKKEHAMHFNYQIIPEKKREITIQLKINSSSNLCYKKKSSLYSEIVSNSEIVNKNTQF